MNMQKVIIIVFAFSIGLFSCTEREKNTISINDINDISDIEKELGLKGQRIKDTPDSLRSAEDKAFFQKIEAVGYEGCTIKNGRFEITISREEIKAMGLPEELYDKITRECKIVNNFLDTITSHPKQLFFDSFLKAKEEYMARKESQHSE